jgi:hypothetical protein
MSDNLLLTLLGAVGVGALVMGLNSNKETLQENWGPNGSIQLRKVYETVQVDQVDGKQSLSSVNFAEPSPQLKQAIATVAKMNSQGVPQRQQLATLTNKADENRAQQMAQFSRIAKSGNPMIKESYEGYEPNYSYGGLGSNAVTSNDYVSYPQFNQNVPLQSPSLNLPSQIRYNPPSLDKMGLTDAYQSNGNNSYIEKPLDGVMDYANIVEGYMSPSQSPYEGPAYVANQKSFQDAIDKGNKDASADFSSQDGLLPLSTMENGGAGKPTMMYERLMYSTGRLGGWRQAAGGSDLIRGDLAVCTDPCQKGWFQSSLQPKDLRVGALGQIAGNSEAGATISSFVQQNGATGVPSINPKLTTMEKALLSTPSGTSLASVASFA